MTNKTLIQESLSLLKELIAVPSFSREEMNTANLIASFLENKGIVINRIGNNIWVKSKDWDPNRPTLLLNSHHDTVKPVSGWTMDPFQPTIKDGKLFGLGSNDAGASLVALLATFRFFFEQKNCPCNLIFAATAEEEISGKDGIALALPQLGKIDFGIIGEPTQMRMAIAEKGLMVIDGVARGKAGHAAREEGVNALYLALADIQAIQHYSFDQVSTLLGKTKATVTQINAGIQHNVIPDQCQFVIDVRTNERYTNEEVFELLCNVVQSELKARSFRLGSSSIALEHPLVQSGLRLNLAYYGSPTLSDQALIRGFPTVKIGCGKSARSHTANEFIQLNELEEGVEMYISLIRGLKF